MARQIVWNQFTYKTWKPQTYRPWISVALNILPASLALFFADHHIREKQWPFECSFPASKLCYNFPLLIDISSVHFWYPLNKFAFEKKRCQLLSSSLVHIMAFSIHINTIKLGTLSSHNMYHLNSPAPDFHFCHCMIASLSLTTTFIGWFLLKINILLQNTMQVDPLYFHQLEFCRKSVLLVSKKVKI